MSTIYQEFESQLGRWQTHYARHPDREIARLYLLALEREQNVTIAYGERVVARRVAKLPVSEEVRTLIRSALCQVWKDEELHTIYAREALRDLGGPALRARSLAQQLAGAVGGWTVSVLQHLRWSEAPFTRALATFSLWLGSLVGRVPKTVRVHLRYVSFRDFCRCNVETERTAWRCWQRLAELASEVPEVSPNRIVEILRIAEDEDRHGRVFGILADGLADGDELKRDVTAEELRARLNSVLAIYNDATVRTSTIPQRIDRSRAA